MTTTTRNRTIDEELDRRIRNYLSALSSYRDAHERNVDDDELDAFGDELKNAAEPTARAFKERGIACIEFEGKIVALDCEGFEAGVPDPEHLVGPMRVFNLDGTDPHRQSRACSVDEQFHPADLAEVADAWPSLPEPIKAAVLALVRTADSRKGGGR